MNGNVEMVRPVSQLLRVIFHIGACVFTTGVSAQTESAIKPEIATSLATFGLTFVEGTYGLISSAGKSTVTPEDAAVIGNQAKMFVDQYQHQVRAGAYGANMLHTTLSLAITTGQVMGSSTVAGAVPAAAIATVVRYGNDKVRGYIVGDTVAKAAATLSLHVDAMSTVKKAKFESLLAEKKFNEATQYFEDNTQKLSTMKDALGDDPQAKGIMDKAILSALMTGSTSAIKIAGESYTSVANLEVSFTNHVKGVSAFTTKAAAKFAQLDESVKELKTGLANQINVGFTRDSPTNKIPID